MSHTSTEMNKFFGVFNKQIPTKHKRAAGHKCAGCSSNIEAPTKMKRLKTRKERSMRRRSAADHPTIKSHHRDRHETSQDFFHNCCQSRCHCSSRKEFLCAAEEPSIITSKRLIGHHRRFNHEVKSVDIERLLTEKMRVGKGGRKEARKADTSAHPSRCPSVPVSADQSLPAPSHHRPASDDDEMVPFGKQPGPTEESRDDCQEKMKEILYSTHRARGKTPLQNPEPSADKHMNEKSNPNDSQATPSTLNEDAATQRMNMTPPEAIPKVASPPVQEMKTKHLPSGQTNSSLTVSSGGKSSKKSGTQDSKELTECVRAAVLKLCGTHYFPLLKRRDLEAESKAALMKALRERQGPDLHENLKQVQRCSKLNVEYVGSVQNPSRAPAARDECELQSTDPFSMPVLSASTSQSLFGSQEKPKFKMKEKKRHNRKSSSRSCKKASDWLPSPEETSGRLFEDLFGKGSPLFDKNFDPATFSSRDHLFTTSSNWGTNTSECEDLDVWPKVAKMPQFNFFDGLFVNNTRSPTEGRSGVQPIDMQPASSLCQCSSEPNRTHFKQIFPDGNPFFAASFDDQRSRFHRTSAPSFLSSRQTHQFPHFPVLEEASSPLTSLLSPEPWAFPPMRLY